MACLEIICWPDERLRTVCEPVTEFDENLKKLADDMLETLHSVPGLGLAAPQVGVHKRLVIIDEHLGHPYILVNPRIVSQSGEIDWSEACLSVPDVSGTITRARNVTVEYQALDGSPQTLEAQDRLAVCLAHECDHLDGRLYFDHLGTFERKALLNRYNSIRLAAESKSQRNET